MNKIIELDSEYEFSFLEEKIQIEHPLSDYYTKLDDLSINLYINLKWIKWGYYFLRSIDTSLESLKDDYSFKEIISKSIQNIEIQKEEKKELIIDNNLIENDLEFNNLIERFYNNKELGIIFSENTKIQMKLKLNLREYLIITNVLYPTLIRWK